MATTPWGDSVRAWVSSRARGTVSTGTRMRAASSSMRSSWGEGSWSSASRMRRTDRRPTLSSSSTARRPSTWSPPSSLRPSGRGRRRGSGRPRGPWRRSGLRAWAHTGSSRTTARQAMPSARPSAPRPSARVALTETGAPSTAPQPLHHGRGVGRQARRVGHHGAVGVGAAVALARRHADHLGQQGHAVGPLPHRVGVGEVAAQIAQPDRARARRRPARGRRRRRRCARPGRGRPR